MIDFHSHVIPETIIGAMRRDPERYATRIEDEAGKRYLVRGRLRLELLAEFSVAEAKLEAMDRKGIEISVISPGPQVFFYGLPENQGVEAARLVNDGIAAMVARQPAYAVSTQIVRCRRLAPSAWKSGWPAKYCTCPMVPA